MFKLVICRGGRGRGDRGRGRGDRGRGRGRGKEEKVMQFLQTILASLASCDDHLVLSWTKMITYGFIWSRTCEWDDNDGEFNSWNLYFNFPQEWIPVTKLGRLVKDGKIKSLEEIYLFSLPIKVSSKREPAWDSKFRIIGHCLIRNNPKFLKAKIPINFHCCTKTYKATRLSLIVRNLFL